MSTSGLRGESVEERLRAALGARAGSVGPQDLRPAAPPSGYRTVRAGLAVRRAALVLFGLAAAVACVLFLVSDGDRGQPVRPAGVPSTPHEKPTPTETPSPEPSIPPSESTGTPPTPGAPSGLP